LAHLFSLKLVILNPFRNNRPVFLLFCYRFTSASRNGWACELDIVLGLRHIHGTGVDAFNIFEILRSPKSTFL